MGGGENEPFGKGGGDGMEGGKGWEEERKTKSKVEKT